MSQTRPPTLRIYFALLIGICVLLPGCSWLGSLQQTESDPAFPAWSQSMSNGVRGPKEKKQSTPRDLLTDDRAQEINKNLGL